MIGDAFLTGSQCYGFPNTKSDVDIVIRLNEDMADVLSAYADKETLRGPTEEEATKYGIVVTAPTSRLLQFGKVQLIVALTDKEFDIWKRSNERCILEAPINRKHAVTIHKEVRRESAQESE